MPGGRLAFCFLALLVLSVMLTGCVRKTSQIEKNASDAVQDTALPDAGRFEWQLNESDLASEEEPYEIDAADVLTEDLADSISGFFSSEEMLVPEGPPLPSTCANGVPDPDESDVDCGGSCPIKCAGGQRCIFDRDCGASNCTSGTCAEIPGAPGAYADYEFRGIDRTDNLEMFLTWIDRPPENVGVYAAFTFGFEAGQGGYMGLQRDGSLPKDRALFSIWSINDSSQTAECVRTDFNDNDLIRCGKLTDPESGEGNFGQALGMYGWKTGREYRLRIESAGFDETGEFWKMTVTDMATNTTTEIGIIHLDDVKGFHGYGKLNPKAAVFLEYYYGHPGYCDENNVYSRVIWRGPYVNGRLADRGYTWYPIRCMYTREYSPEPGILVMEGGGKTAWDNHERDFWNISQ